MKLQVKETEVKQILNLLAIGYCEAQNLLRYETPRCYVKGVGGWKSDIYFFDDFAISTGYAPQGVKVNYSLLRELEKEAEREVYSGEIIEFEERKRLNRERLQKLFADYWKEKTGRDI